jgi:hypothetical protein
MDPDSLMAAATEIVAKSIPQINLKDHTWAVVKGVPKIETILICHWCDCKVAIMRENRCAILEGPYECPGAPPGSTIITGIIFP